MSQIKHNEGITGHLQRIFIYGDEMALHGRVNSFIEFLSGRINPFTDRPYELGGRSLYKYISGEQHFPVDLLPPLVSWSLDEKLMAAYNMYPAPSDSDRIKEKLSAIEQSIDKSREQARLLRLQLKHVEK